ncbi:hypothetical protein EVAR_10437_1 [Eumeta japonica]|uniref:Uncharacterized protein n=1 Tax=Eumeta variegata TaxID=151549 RepID=A0A4C1TKM2_EUMVA|nr:hypothetical protein EVAR_10437_1 [Eumeta japonica]
METLSSRFRPRSPALDAAHESFLNGGEYPLETETKLSIAHMTNESQTGTVQRTKLCRSELAANDVPRRYYVARPFLLLRRVSILRHRDALATNFTAAKFRVLYYKSVRLIL